MFEVIMHGNSEFESFNDDWNVEDIKIFLAHFKDTSVIWISLFFSYSS